MPATIVTAALRYRVSGVATFRLVNCEESTRSRMSPTEQVVIR